MKRIIAILITFLMLVACCPLESVAKEKNKKKKQSHKKSWLYRFLHKRHDRLQKWNTGHTEFKNRPKREQKKISRHHLDPNKPIKDGKKKGKKDKEKDSSGKDTNKEAPAETPQQEAPSEPPPPQEAPPAEPPAPAEPPKEDPK